MKGYFITFEGGEGSGKSSTINVIKEKLDSLGLDVVLSREPGGIKISEQIRDVILDKNNTEMACETEALLYAASRVQHIKEKIIPALELGYIVICDRYIDSSIAYQGVARNIGVNEVLACNMFALKTMPDVTYFIDVEPEVGLKRIEGRDKLDRLDLEALEFHKLVYGGYLQACEMYPKRIVRVDGTVNLDKMILYIYDDIIRRLKDNGYFER